MDFILKRDWIREGPRKTDRNFAGSTCHTPSSTFENGSSLGLVRGRVPSPSPSRVAVVGAKLLPVGDDLVDDQKEMEAGRPRSSHDTGTTKNLEEHLKRSVEKQQKQKQRTANLQKLVDHQGSIINSLQQQLAIAKADFTDRKPGEPSEPWKQNLPATSSLSALSFSTNSTDSDVRWTATAELNVQVTHRGIQCDIDPENDVKERLKELSDDRELLRTDVRELLHEKRFWQDKCRMVLGQMQLLEEKSKVGDKVLSSEKNVISKSCSELSKELENLKGRCAEHENCTSLKDSSLKEIERLTNLANDISKERKGLQQQVEHLQKRMESHLDKFSRLKEELNESLKERDAAISRAEAAIQNAQLLQSDRDHWKEQCNSAYSELQRTHLFHEELGRVYSKSQHDVERFQDEVVTLRSALKTQSGEMVKREQDIQAWQQRAEELETELNQVQERMKSGMSELRLQVECRDRTIQQQKQHLAKMPQIQADLVTLRAELQRTITAVSDSCRPTVEEISPLRDEKPSCICHSKFNNTDISTSTESPLVLKDKSTSTFESPVILVDRSTSETPLCFADTSTSTSEAPVCFADTSTSTSETSHCFADTSTSTTPHCFADNSTSTSETPVCFADASTSTSEIPVYFAGSSTSTFINPIGSSTSENIDPSETASEFNLDDLLESNFSLLDVSVEKLGQLLKGGGDTRVKHIETQTDLARECALDVPDKGDADADADAEKRNEIAEESVELVFERAGGKMMKLEVDSGNNCGSENIVLKESASVSAAVLVEIFERVYDDAMLKKVRAFEGLKDQLNIECREAMSERDTLEVLLKKETSARFAVSKRLEEAESQMVSLTKNLKEVLERLASCETQFCKRIEEKTKDLAVIEADLSKERAQTALLEKKIASSGRALSEMIILSKLLQNALSGESEKYERAVRVFRKATLCLTKELCRHVRKIDAVNKTIGEGNKFVRNFYLGRTNPSKRLRRTGGRRKRQNMAKVLRKRVRQAIWHSGVFQEGTDVKNGKVLGVAIRRRKNRRSFNAVCSELRKNVVRLKLTRDRAVAMMKDQESKMADLESENQELCKEKSSLEKKLLEETERGELKIRMLKKELASAQESHLQIRQQMREVLSNCRREEEAKVVSLKELKSKGTSPLRDEIGRVRVDLEKERNRSYGTKKEASELNNYFHVLEDYVRNQPISSSSNFGNQGNTSNFKEAGFVEITPRRSGISKEAFAPTCPHQDGMGCCPESNLPSLECPLCFLKTHEVVGSNAGLASRAVRLAHECARRLNLQALSHQANLASLEAAHQRDLTATREAHSVGLLRLQSKQQSELARVRREVRAELKASLKTEVRANINAVVERSLAGVEHLHRVEMRRLSRSLSSPLKVRIGKPSEIGQEGQGYHTGLKNQINQLPPNLDWRHGRKIVLLTPDDRSCDELLYDKDLSTRNS